jgi:Cu-Zn family superoxide dismutase
LAGALASCWSSKDKQEAQPARHEPVSLVQVEGARVAEAVIEGRSGVSLKGRARFTELTDSVLVEVWLENAPPGKHAVHVHEKGDCGSKDGSSAGGHFNPADAPHGSPQNALHHAGDLGNMWVAEDGSGYHQIASHDLTVGPGSHSVIGRSIIVHADPDDMITQPTGAAGGRIGCGRIE